MLKSFEFIKSLELLLNRLKKSNIIDKFKIKLSTNQNVRICISSSQLTNLEALLRELSSSSTSSSESYFIENMRGYSISFDFYSSEESVEEYSYEFSGEVVDYGLRRSLSALLENAPSKQTVGNVITFYSYKGGVGRTTSLALCATYLARKGNRVFVIDCDFEAPGLINFFNTSQSDIQKPGVIEYLNDKSFNTSTLIEDYVYEVEKGYSGIGTINFMPAGNVLGESNDLQAYIEGIARLDLQSNVLIQTFQKLITDINEKYGSDVILIDSRTGFNNIFGALVNLSSAVISFSGDDTQNMPGTEYVTELLSQYNINQCYVLSILSSNYSKRYNNFTNYIAANTKSEAETFYLDRQNTLEFIGTPLSDTDDLNDFINGENGSPQYQKLFDYVDSLIDVTEPNNEIELDERSEEQEDSDALTKNVVPDDDVREDVLTALKHNLPDLYAENIEYTNDYIEHRFYIRPCMEDFFIPEKTLLLGDKGTGKTAFYKALQVESVFELLVEKSQKKHLHYKVLNVTDYENDNFELLGLDERFIKNELFIKKFWIFYIWKSLASRGEFSSTNTKLLVDLEKTDAIAKIIGILENEDNFKYIEEEVAVFNDGLRAKDERMILTFDRLDNIVKPFLWNDVVSPLVKLCMKFPWQNMHPKLFLRRDLYERLGNLTNKSSFKPRVIDLEWSKNEIYSYFLKIIFTYSGGKFTSYLIANESASLVDKIKSKLKKKGSRNQLPLDIYIIQPVINAFFGKARPKKNGKVSSAYEDLYRNIQSADSTVNLRPFLDLLKYAIEEQEQQDQEKQFRKGAVLGLAYCTSRYVRKQAVVNYLEDLWGEQGNELVRYFCEDLAYNRVNPKYKKPKLDEKLFESLLQDIRERHIGDGVVKKTTINEFKQILIANKIITPYMVGNKTRYGYAYLYTNYLGV